MLLLGNDIVDLNATGIRGKSRDTRFMQRVFNHAERERICASSHPDLALWMFWAAKESAFKLVSKICGPPVFAHRKFRISTLRQTAAASFEVRAVYRQHSFPIRISHTDHYIHAVGGNFPADARAPLAMKSGVQAIEKRARETWGDSSVQKGIFTRAERASIHRAESALVRFICKKSIAATLRISPSRLQIVRPVRKQRPQPPFVLHNGNPCDIDISLSHHGRWVGWCFSADGCRQDFESPCGRTEKKSASPVLCRECA